MSGEQSRLDAYLETVKRMEPDVSMVDASFAYASISISLKRIADALEKKASERPEMVVMMTYDENSRVSR